MATYKIIGANAESKIRMTLILLVAVLGGCGEGEAPKKSPEQLRVEDRVSSLTLDARDALTEGELDEAIGYLVEAASATIADNRDSANKLMELIERSGDVDYLKGLAINLRGEQFRAMVNDGVFPESLDFGFDVLNERALALTLENIDGVKEVRAEHKRQRIAAKIEQNRLEAERKEREAAERELARLAEEERKRQEAEEAERKRIAAQERIEEQRERDQAEQKELDQKSKAFLKLLEFVEADFVESIHCLRDEDEFTVRITVSAAWHMASYDDRLGLAKVLWGAWAEIASPHNTSMARIEILDRHGNKIGGSKFLSNRKIWVDR